MEFNPQLRVEENVKGIQAQLDYLSFKCGLGNKHYQFNSGTVVTATQYTGDKQDLIQNADKHYTAVERFLVSLMRSIIYIGGRLTGANVKDNADIEICFDRSVIIDEAAERLQDSQDVRDGLMAKWEYRMKYYGETEEDASPLLLKIVRLGLLSTLRLPGFFPILPVCVSTDSVRVFRRGRFGRIKNI